MERMAAYLGFNFSVGIGPTRLRRLIEHFGSPEAAWLASEAQLCAAGLDGRSTRELLETRRRIDAQRELERVLEAGVSLYCWEDPRYPYALAQLEDAPPLLYVRGSLAEADRWAVAVVGTRMPTNYGREATYRLVCDLATTGITIISGLALGVDTIAHRAALEAGGRTIAVLGCGVGRVYPERNASLAAEIAERGAVISEYAPDLPPLAGNFPARNRLISGLSLGVLVIEAGERSGALITARFALDQGRDVLAVPGTIFSAKSSGTNRLIAEGATLVRSADDVLQTLNLAQRVVQQELALVVPESPLEQALLAALSREPLHIDELGRATRLAPGDLAAMLSMLELKGYVRHVGGMCYVRSR